MPEDRLATINEETEPTAVLDRRSGLAVAVALLLANVANYGFQIVTGRMLSVEEYGLLAGFMSAITIITVTTSALQTTAARSIAAGESFSDKHSLSDGLTRTALVGSSVCAAVIMAAAPVLSRFFNIGTLPILLLGVYVVPSALDSIAAGRLQGSKRFSGLAIYSASQALAKVGVASVFIFAGLRVTGLVAGLTLSAGAVALLGMFASRSVGAVEAHVLDADTRRGLAAFLLFWVILSSDIAFARAFFDPKAAGVYAAAAVLGKAVLWLPTMVSQLFFPGLADISARGGAATSVAKRAVVLILGLSCASVGGLYLLGGRVFSLLYGSRYDGAAGIAWKIGVAMIPLSLVNFLLFHFLARRQGRFLWWMGLALVGELVALYLGPKSGEGYAMIVGATGFVLLMLMAPRSAWRRLPPMFGREA